MARVFRKALMQQWITENHKEDMVDDSVREMMDKLDGQEATESCWDRVVKGNPVLWCTGKDGVGTYVREEWCRFE